MKTVMLVFVMTLFVGIAFGQSTQTDNEPHEKASDSKVRFHSTSLQYEKASDFRVRFFSSGYFRENLVMENNRKYFKPYQVGVFNKSLLLNNFKLRTRTSKDKC